MPPPGTPGQAASSCFRCQRRKKRCDRNLPQCRNCTRASVICSFSGDDDQTAFYPVSYVRALETRVQELEQTLASLQHAETQISQDETSQSDALTRLAPVDGGMVTSGEIIHGFEPPALREERWSDLAMFPEGAMLEDLPAAHQTLDEEMKHLVLEAAAERYLGSSSGLSLAKLTQMILQRLPPRDGGLMLGNILSKEALEHVDYTSPSALSNFRLFNIVNPSITSGSTSGFDFNLGTIKVPDTLVANLKFPDDATFDRLVDFYFAHSHTLYPLIDHGSFRSSVQTIRETPQASWAQSPLCLFRVWMVLAIGSTASCSITRAAESEAALYYNKAVAYFEDAFGLGDMAALEAVLLQISYSFFSQLGPNTWYLVGIAARIALGMGLQSQSAYEGLSFDMAQQRKRLFFSLYMMDRVISIPLGRPFAIQDDDIDITPFVETDDCHADRSVPEMNQPKTPLAAPALAIPLHVLALRRISSKITTLVYAKRAAGLLELDDRERIIRNLNEELVQWRRTMPFPLPASEAHVPHLTSIWYDLNYYTHLAMLYRPSPLFPAPDQRRMKILAESASMAIRHTSTMHLQGTFSYNWLNLLTFYTSTIALVYAVTAETGDVGNTLEDAKVAHDIQLSIQLFESLEAKLPATRQITAIFNNLLRRFVSDADRAGEFPASGIDG